MTHEPDEKGWRKSSRSAQGGDCVEVKAETAIVYIRDSKQRDGETLRFARKDFAAFVAGVKAGDFDGPSAQDQPLG